MTVYDVVAIGSTVGQAAKWCERYARGDSTPTLWAAITPDMLRHFSDVGAKWVANVSGGGLTDEQTALLNELLKRGSRPTEAA
jgi:hypothetical protein